MKGPRSWWWGTSSPLGSGLLPVSLIPPPVVCSACFCPVGPFQKMPPEHENTKQWVNSVFTLSCKNCQLTFLDIILGEHITMSHREYSAHIEGPWELTKVKQRCSETVMLLLASLLSAPTSPNHLYQQVIYYPQWHATAAPCCTETLKAQRVAISIINEMCFTVLDL